MRRRTRVWWVAAAASQWLSNGALFVAPVCAIVLFLSTLRRFGWREALRASLPAALWLLSFAANYFVALGPARSSEFLQGYWTPAFPPAGADVAATLAWLGAQFAPLAIKPGGSGFPVAFWIAAAAGFAFGRPRGSGRRLFSAVFALVPAAAFVLTGIRLVPMSERLTLWIVPALYVGIALALEGAVRWTANGVAYRRLAPAIGGALAVAALATMFEDIFRNGMTYVALTPQTVNHDLDDRGAIRWLARQSRPGDVWIAPWNSLPAIWWYAAPDSASVLESSYVADGSACGAREIGATLIAHGHRRALVYFGFAHDIPPAYDNAVLSRLSGIGTVSGYRRFGRLGHAVVIDIESGPSRRPATLANLSGDRALAAAPPRGGCVSVRPARPW